MPASEHGHHCKEDTIAFARNSKLDVSDYAFYPLREIVVVQRNPVYVRVTQWIISHRHQVSGTTTCWLRFRRPDGLAVRERRCRAGRRAWTGDRSALSERG